METHNKMPIYITPEDERSWVPLREILPIVGMNKVQFYYHVRHHAVRVNKSEQNDRDNVYNLADAKRLRAKRDNLEIRYEHNAPSGVRWVSPADLGYLSTLEYDLFGSYPEHNNQFVRWLEINDRIALGAFNQDNLTECLAYMSAVPMHESQLLQMLKNWEPVGSMIEHLEVLSYGQSNREYTLLVHAIAYREEKYLKEVLVAFINYWKSLLPGETIARLYGLGGKQNTVLKSLGFSQVSTISETDQLCLLPAYHLGMLEDSSALWLEGYQDALQEYR